MLTSSNHRINALARAGSGIDLEAVLSIIQSSNSNEQIVDMFESSSIGSSG
jgi:hypothetical protein